MTTGTPNINGKAKSAAPTHTAYHIRELGSGENKQSFWTRIGAAWPHSDGNGFFIQIDAAPLDGRITLRIVTDKKN